MVWGLKNSLKAQDVAGIKGTSSRPDNISNGSDQDSSPTAASEKQRDIAVETDELSRFEKAHQYDQNMPKDKLDEMRDAVRSGDVEIIQEDVDLIESSPYQEVRAAVRDTDGGEVANTVRAWVLGMLFVTIASGLNMFLSMRLVKQSMLTFLSDQK